MASVTGKSPGKSAVDGIGLSALGVKFLFCDIFDGLQACVSLWRVAPANPSNDIAKSYEPRFGPGARLVEPIIPAAQNTANRSLFPLSPYCKLKYGWGGPICALSQLETIEMADANKFPGGKTEVTKGESWSAKTTIPLSIATSNLHLEITTTKAHSGLIYTLGHCHRVKGNSIEWAIGSDFAVRIHAPHKVAKVTEKAVRELHATITDQQLADILSAARAHYAAEMLTAKARYFLAQKPTKIGTVGVVDFYEHPTRGDTEYLVAILPDGRVKLSDWFDLPSEDELADWSVWDDAVEVSGEPSAPWRVVYGETMPAWEKTFPTEAEAQAFAEDHKKMGDQIFSIAQVVPGEKPQSLTAAITTPRGWEHTG